MVIIKVIAAIMLLIALGSLSYSYYIALRWIVAIVSAISAFDAFGKQKTGWAWVFITLVIIFNPIIPVYLTKQIWAPIDIASAIILLASIGAVRIINDD